MVEMGIWISLIPVGKNSVAVNSLIFNNTLQHCNSTANLSDNFQNYNGVFRPKINLDLKHPAEDFP